MDTKFVELSEAIYNNKLILGTAMSFALTASPDEVSRIVSDKEKTVVYYKNKNSETFWRNTL